MRQRLSLILIALLVIAPSVPAGQPPRPAVEAIRTDAMAEHLAFLASDRLLGRDTPSAGLDTAAAWIAGLFEQEGLQPVNGSYFQEFALNKVFLGDSNSCRIAGRDGSWRDYRIKKEFMPYEMTASKAGQGEIVFAGYGISTPELGYDDYAGIDVKGKVVFVLKRGPRQNDPASPFFLHKDVSFARVDEKIKTAIERGAAGIMLVTDPLHNKMLSPRGFPWPNLFKGFPPDAVPVTLGRMEKEKIPAIQVGVEAINQLFGSVEALRQLQQAIDSTMTPHSQVLTGCRAEILTTTRTMVQKTRNVVGLIPGADPRLKDEVVVIGAHYDHTGYQKNAPAGEDSVYNGADDNASGTVGVLAVASAFARAGKAPKRSVLCIAFAGEEKGLFGSTHYVAEPLMPLEKTAAMLNMDMISRNNPDSLTVTGTSTSVRLKKALLQANKKTGFTLDTSAEKILRGGSDHAPFVKKEIPVLFFHGGTHPDYHKVSDEIAKCDITKMSRAAELCFRVAWQVANEKSKPEFAAAAKPAK